MGLNLVQFPDSAKIAEISAKLLDSDVLVCPAGQKMPGPAGPKMSFRSCALLVKKDGNALHAARKTSDFVAVRGSTPELCSWAANSKGVDLLLQPFSSERCFLDLQTANVLAQNDVYVCFLFGEFLEADGSRLPHLIKNASMCARLCRSAGAKMLFVSGAKNEMQMRASKDLASFAALIGVKKEEALKAVRSGAEDFLGRLK